MSINYFLSSLPVGAIGYILPALFEQFKQAKDGLTIVVVKEETRAYQLAEQVAFFAPEFGVKVFPAWDSYAYEATSPSKDVVAQRIQALAGVLFNRVKVLIIPAKALSQKVPSLDYWQQQLQLNQGEKHSFEKILICLAQLGYNRVETVQEVGEYAVRGGIIDVFSSALSQPARLDFWGDEIEKIELFDPLSQRREEAIKSLTLLPAREFLFDAKALKWFKEKSQITFEDQGQWQHFAENFSQGIGWPGIEYVLPFFHDSLVSPLGLFNPSLIVCEGELLPLLEAVFQESVEAYKLHRQERKKGETLPPVPPELLFTPPQELKVFLSEAERLPLVEIFLYSLAAYSNSQQLTLNEEIKSPLPLLEPRLINAEGGQRIPVFCQLTLEALEAKKKVLLTAYSEASIARCLHILKEHGIEAVKRLTSFHSFLASPFPSVEVALLDLSFGFCTAGFLVITEQEIFGTRLSRPVKRRRRAEVLLKEISTLQEEDYIVHQEHGIGRYQGLISLEINGALHDCVKVVYQGDDRLFVPVENIEVLSRYGPSDAQVTLDKLGAAAWQSRKARVKKKIQEIADRLLAIAAERQLSSAEVFLPASGSYEEFCAQFPYPETDDQLNAIEEVIEDLAKGRPMDRLICGDVGFGKTEVALRAAFIVAMTGKQVVVVTPTTLLCRQHYAVFKKRFEGFGIRIEQLSRLCSRNDVLKVKEDLAKGLVGVVVATHAILSNEVKFAALGLVIIDEEHHFGVAQKERLKSLQADVHVLTLTATPIPRTLHMALSGVREMSLIATPPVDRLAVKTYVMAFEAVTIREAILREKHRGGQIFYVCPRLEDLDKVAQTLTQLVPEVRFTTAHGQMKASELEKVMEEFCGGKFDLLLSTTIIESGIDLPKANTLIIYRADLFGLAQLYQLRGRVGRGALQGYAYFLLPHYDLKAKAVKRLSVIQSLDSLGAGFTLASHDMDIRGAGNLVGAEQSGHVREVGVELYQSLLQEAIESRKNSEKTNVQERGWSPQINLNIAVLIPPSYITDASLRLQLYRRAGELRELEEVKAFAEEIKDRFGNLPPEVGNFLEILKLKVFCLKAGVERIDAGPKGAVLTFRHNDFANPSGLLAFIAQKGGVIKLRPDHKLVMIRAWEDPVAYVKGLIILAEKLAEIATA